MLLLLKSKVIYVLLLFSLLFSVTAGIASTSITRTITLQDNQIFVLSFDGSKGESLQLNYTVISGGSVDIITLNESNYNLYINGWLNKNYSSFSYQGEFSAINTTHALLNAKVLVSQTYFVVIENSNYFVGGATAKGPVQVTISIHNISSTPGFGFTSVIAFFICTGAFIAVKKRKWF